MTKIQAYSQKSHKVTATGQKSIKVVRQTNKIKVIR